MRKLIALEPEVYEKLKNKHQVTDKKVLSELDAKMQEILTSNRPDSEKVTLYNEALQKSKLFLKKFQPKTPVKKPLFESAVLKRFKKRTKAKKLFKAATSKKEFRLERRRSNAFRRSSGTWILYRRFVSIHPKETRPYFTRCTRV